MSKTLIGDDSTFCWTSVGKFLSQTKHFRGFEFQPRIEEKDRVSSEPEKETVETVARQTIELATYRLEPPPR